MGERSLPKPTGAELELLRVLWNRGPSTVREVHEAVSGRTGYTTTLKILQKMAEKGLVRRDERARSHVYTAACGAETTQRQLVRDLIRRAFGGSPAKLVMQALSEERATPEELAEIRRLLDEVEPKKPRRRT
jgi:BlaI family transcriptional regulator, penicillinase repressor